MSIGAGAANINGGVMKENNLRLILQTVRAQQRVSRKELATLTRLTPATITNLVRELIRDGFLLEGERGESRSGPRPIFLELNPAWGYVVGVELTATDIFCVLTDFRARVLFRSQVGYEMELGRATVLNLLVQVVTEAMTASAVDIGRIRGIGIVSAGPFSRERGEMIAPPNFPGWGRTPIKRFVEERVGLPVWFDKETQAAAFGEYWFGQAEQARVLFACNVFRVGIGGGILLDGKAYRGHRENAANIGHTKVVLQGERCTCGEQGCLETVADGRAAVRAVRARFTARPEDFPGVPTADGIDFDYVIRAAEEGHPACREEVALCASYVGMALANVVRTVAPDTVVLCGEFPDGSEYFVQRCIESAMQRFDPGQEDVRIYHSTLGPEIAALGGVAIVLDNLGPSPEDS